MTMAHNIAASHRLEPIAGYDEITHLQFTGPMEKETLIRGNGVGEEPGLPAGSVVSLNSGKNLEAGATGTAMPMFLLWNTSDPDGFPAALTANERSIAGIPMIGGGFEGENFPENNSMLRQTFKQETGGLNSLVRTINKGVSSYAMKSSTGNFTAWPATCGLEVTSTEWDFNESNPRSAFAPNKLLTSPKAKPSTAIVEGTGDNKWFDEAKQYQKRRGGYLKVLNTATDAEDGFYNVCGTVSRGIHTNENGVDVLYFWAERTLIPAGAATAASIGTSTDATDAGTVWGAINAINETIGTADDAIDAGTIWAAIKGKANA